MALKRRVVVAGLGSIGRRHARLLLEREDVAVEVVDPRIEAVEALRNELGPLPAHPSFESALATRPDFVWIATPTHLHSTQAVEALSAGCHVFCEKPMAADMAGALRMKASSDRSAGVLCIGFYLHFWDAMQAAKKLILDGALGRLLHAHARVGTYITLVNSESRYQASNPGSLFFDYAHQPDLLYWLTGRAPRAVTAFGFQGGKLDLSSSPNVADIVCEYDGALLTTIHLNYVQMPQRHLYELVGDEGWASIDFETRQMTLGRRAGQTIETRAFPQERDDMFRAEHRAFFDAAGGRRAPETSAADGLVSTAICDAILESWRTGSRIRVEEW